MIDILINLELLYL